MKKKSIAILLFALLLMPFLGRAQAIPANVKAVYPKATELRQLDNGWVAVKKGKKLLGYVAYSQPASDGIKGFKGETPLLICFDANQKIMRVTMLPNGETPSYAHRVEAAGLLDTWNGMGVDKALSVAPDVVSGATYTSRSVISSMNAALKQLSAQKPSPSKSRSGISWMVLVLSAAAVVGVFFAARRRKVAAR